VSIIGCFQSVSKDLREACLLVVPTRQAGNKTRVLSMLADASVMLYRLRRSRNDRMAYWWEQSWKL